MPKCAECGGECSNIIRLFDGEVVVGLCDGCEREMARSAGRAALYASEWNDGDVGAPGAGGINDNDCLL